MYVDIPAHIKLNKKPADTPFRFRNFEEALNSAKDMFPHNETRVVGSKDQPHWQKPEKEGTISQASDVTPSYQKAVPK